MEYVAEIHPHDEVVESNGARVMIAPMAQMFLFGTEIDYADRPDRIGLPVQQPQRRRGLRLRRIDQVRRHADLAVSAATRAFVLELFEDLGGVTARAMMGGLASTATASLFALVTSDERIYLKASAGFAAALAAEGGVAVHLRARRQDRPAQLLDPARGRARRPGGRLRLGAPRARAVPTLPPSRRLC